MLYSTSGTEEIVDEVVGASNFLEMVLGYLEDLFNRCVFRF